MESNLKQHFVHPMLAPSFKISGWTNLILKNMPCHDGRENVRTEYITEYINGVDPEPYNYKIKNLKEEVSRLEAGLCAIITELEKKGIANEVISQASKNGLINLMEFWEKHSKEDESRLSKKFHSFSEHEQDLIRKMVRDGKI